MPELSIVVPVYNEKDTIEEVIRRLQEVPLEKEIIIVDDGSTDGTKKILARCKTLPGMKVICQPRNQGKGSALRKGFKYVSGKYTTIQDADLEYNPQDLVKMYHYAREKGAAVVYGNRFWVKGKPKNMAWANYIFNWLVAWLATILFGQRLHDVATCYKMFKTDLLKTISLWSRRFEFCPEVTAKLKRRGVRIWEVPISYRPRTKKAGKKIRTSDAFVFLWTLVKYRFLK